MSIVRGATLTVIAAFAVFGQPAASRLGFEVASVKPALDKRLAGGRLTVTSQALTMLIRQAYDVAPCQMPGGPGSLDEDKYDIDAKAAGDPSRELLMAMLQTLLADRSKLKVRRETRDGPAFALTVAKNGAMVKQPKGGEESFIRTARTGALDQDAATYILFGQKASMPAFIKQLSGQLGRPVLDRTGIDTESDYRLEFASDDAQPDVGPSIFAAVQEQLGLKLEAAKGPVEILVIDHAKKPSGN